MFNLQGSEIIVILLLALVVLGPEKLPGAIRRFTKTYAELKKMGSSFQDEVKTAFDEPMREVRETADLIKKQVDVDALDTDSQPEANDSSAADGDASQTSGVAADAADSVSETVAEPVAAEPHAAMPPPVAGADRRGPDAIPARPNVPAPPPPFSSSTGAPPETAPPEEPDTEEDELPS